MRSGVLGLAQQLWIRFSTLYPNPEPYTLSCYHPSMSTTKTITEADVRHVAKLSRLHVSDEQVRHFTVQLAAVLGHISKLNELDVEGVEPMAHPLELVNVLRPDVEQPGILTDVALANAPAKTPPFFKVPKVLGDGPSA